MVATNYVNRNREQRLESQLTKLAKKKTATQLHNAPNSVRIKRGSSRQFGAVGGGCLYGVSGVNPEATEIGSIGGQHRAVRRDASRHALLRAGCPALHVELWLLNHDKALLRFGREHVRSRRNSGMFARPVRAPRPGKRHAARGARDTCYRTRPARAHQRPVRSRQGHWLEEASACRQARCYRAHPLPG